jgi:hypothetical protein
VHCKNSPVCAATAPDNADGRAAHTAIGVERDVDVQDRQQFIEDATMARLGNRFATLNRASVALATPTGGRGALGAFENNQNASDWRIKTCLRATGVPRRAGAKGGRPRAILSALVSALTTVAATATARTDANFIMFFVSWGGGEI